MMVGVCLGPNYHRVVEFKIFGDMKKALLAEQTSMPFGKADCRLLKDLVSEVSSESAFEGIGFHKCWSIFKTTGTGNSSASKYMDFGSQVRFYRRMTEILPLQGENSYSLKLHWIWSWAVGYGITKGFNHVNGKRRTQ